MSTENENMSSEELKYAVQTIKDAILQSQSRAVQMISGAQLSLYFGVGLYVSANSRNGKWGTGAIKTISEQLRRELPGLRGFSEESIKKMRTFAEYWHHYLNRSPTATDMYAQGDCPRVHSKWSNLTTLECRQACRVWHDY